MRKIIGVLVFFLVAAGFMMAQSVTVEWAKTTDGKDALKFTNKDAGAQTVQYTVKGDKAGSIDIPAGTEVTVPYTGKFANQPIDPPVTKPAAKPKALPKGATSVSLGGAPAVGGKAAPAPASGGKTAAPAPAATPAAGGKAPAPAKK